MGHLMWWPLVLILVGACLADDSREELDLESIRSLDRQLPSLGTFEDEKSIKPNRYIWPNKVVTLERIVKSGLENGHVKSGARLIRIEDNKVFEVTEEFYAKFYRLMDEHGFKYIQNKDGSCVYKMSSHQFTSIEPELELYVPPRSYTLAPPREKKDYDQSLPFVPEFSFYMARVEGHFMRDLFNDPKARNGFGYQLGLQALTSWSLPINVGLALNYGRASFNLKGAGRASYSSLSFGPQIKTRDFEFNQQKFRLQTQYRVGPFAQVLGKTENGDVQFNFNSSDFMIGLEFPYRNPIGEFVFGPFFQMQWLNIKNQSEIVSISASNKSNQSFGLSFSQVFE
jgi:hypothetical protein